MTTTAAADQGSQGPTDLATITAAPPSDPIVERASSTRPVNWAISSPNDPTGTPTLMPHVK